MVKGYRAEQTVYIYLLYGDTFGFINWVDNLLWQRANAQNVNFEILGQFL